MDKPKRKTQFIKWLGRARPIRPEEKRKQRKDEKRLIRLVLRKKKKYWDEFVKKYTRLVYKTIRVILILRGYQIPSRAVAVDDLHRDVFILLRENDFAKLKKFEGRGGCSLASWIRVITTNFVTRYIEKEMTSKGRVTSLDAPININGEGEEITLLDTILGAAFQERENIEKKDRINLVKEKLKRLDTTEQFILVEFFYRGRSHKEIGRLIGKSEDAVSEQKRRIIEKIKKEIKNDVDFT